MHSLEPPYAHNDVKPGNVLITHRKGQPPLTILMDFGSARPARRQIRSRSEALRLQVLTALVFFPVFRYLTLNHCYSANNSFVKSFFCFYWLLKIQCSIILYHANGWILGGYYIGMGSWTLFCTLQGSWAVGLPKPCWYWWENWYLVTRMHFICNNVRTDPSLYMCFDREKLFCWSWRLTGLQRNWLFCHFCLVKDD